MVQKSIQKYELSQPTTCQNGMDLLLQILLFMIMELQYELDDLRLEEISWYRLKKLELS